MKINMENEKPFKPKKKEINLAEESLTEKMKELMAQRLISRGFAPSSFTIAGLGTSKNPISEIERFALTDKIKDLSNQDLEYVYSLTRKSQHLENFGVYDRYYLIWQMIWNEGVERGIFTTDTHDSSKPDLEF